MTVRLDFGPLDLVSADGPKPTYRFDTSGEDLTFGEPAPVEVVLASQVQDGSQTRWDHDDNREIGLRVQITEFAPGGFGDAEAALSLQLRRPNWLVNKAGIDKPATVYEVQTSYMSWLFDDVDEANHKRRTYQVRLTAAPYGRSITETIMSAHASTVATEATPTDLNTCDSTSGATGTTNGQWGATTVSVDTGIKWQGTGSLKLVPAVTTSQRVSGSTYRFTQVAGLSLTATGPNEQSYPFVSFVVDCRYFESVSATLTVNGVTVPYEAAESLADSNGRPFKRLTFWAGAQTGTYSTAVVTVTASWLAQVVNGDPVDAAPADRAIRVDNLRASAVPAGGSAANREALREIPVGGSARSPGSLQINHQTSVNGASGGLGDVLVYTSSRLTKDSGYVPALMRYAGSSTGGTSTSTDASSISGLSANWNTSGLEWRIPVQGLPRGGFLLMAQAKGSATQVQFDVATRVGLLGGGGTMIGTKRYATRRLLLDANGYSLVNMCAITLPATDVPTGSAAVVVIKPVVTTDIFTVGELFAFYIGEDSALSIVSCGTGAPSLGVSNSYLWLDGPTLDMPTRAAYVGTQPGKVDAYHAGDKIAAFGRHTFSPPSVTAFIADSGVPAAAASQRSFHRWLHNAGD